jgi:hypothetical protein
MQQSPVPLSIHRYDTHSKSKALTPIAAFTKNTDTPAYALLGNAINPDTGTITKYKELSQCTEGLHWQASNAKEVGCRTRGFGEQQAPCSSFPTLVFPRTRDQRTYKLFLHTDQRTQIHNAFAGQLMGITYSMQPMSALTLLISLLPRHSSTV